MAAAARVIDSLVVVLGLEASKFTQQQRDALNDLRKFEEGAEAQGKRVESQNKRLTDSLVGLKREVLATTSLFLGGMGVKQFVSYITSADAATGRLAHTMNESVEEVSAWQGAIKQIGGSAESANAALSGLSGEMNRFMLTGQSQMLPVLSNLGISMFDQNGKLKTASALWRDLARAVEGMDPAKATSFLSMIPGANQDMINLMLKGPKAVDEYVNAARRAGVATKESSAAAEEYQKSLAQLDQSATNLGRTLVTHLTPALTTAMDAARRFIQGPDEKAKERAKAFLPKDDGKDGLWDRNVSRWFRLPTKNGNRYYFFDDKAHPESGSKPPPPAPPTPPAAAPSPLAVKPGSGIVSPAMAQVSSVLAGVPGVKQATAFDDPYHAFLGRHSAHSDGRAVDVTITDPTKSGDAADAIRQALAAAGIKATVLDEYKNPSKGSTGGHIHIGVDDATAARLGGGRLGAPAAARITAGATIDNSRSSTTGGNATTVTIGSVQVNAPQAKDADGVAREIAPAIKRAVEAGSANYGAI